MRPVPNREAAAGSHPILFSFDLQALGTPTVNPNGSTTYALTSSVLGNGAWQALADTTLGNDEGEADLPAIEANAGARRGFHLSVTIQPVPVPAAGRSFSTPERLQSEPPLSPFTGPINGQPTEKNLL